MNEPVEVRQAFDERQVEGLIRICKELAGSPEADKMVVYFMPFDPLVVAEAKRRILNNLK